MIYLSLIPLGQRVLRNILLMADGKAYEGKPSQVGPFTALACLVSGHISLAKASLMTIPRVNGVKVKILAILVGGSSR